MPRLFSGPDDKRIKRALCIVAHPDDIEFYCAGVVLMMTGRGVAVDFVLATSGDKGARDTTKSRAKMAQIREREQELAADVSGSSAWCSSGTRMPSWSRDLELREEFVREIRTSKPDVLLTFDPNVPYRFHPDHRVVGRVALDAAWPSARDPLTFPKAGPPHETAEAWCFGGLPPTLEVDVGGVLGKKIEARLAHSSQTQQPGSLLPPLASHGSDREVPPGEPAIALPLVEPPVAGPRLDVKTPVFEGPLELLLALVEREEVDIFQVSLAKVTDSYLIELAAREVPDPAEMAEFLWMAARLLLLKSIRLLPGEPPTDEETELLGWEEDVRLRLEEYRAYKEMADGLMTRAESGAVLVSAADAAGRCGRTGRAAGGRAPGRGLQQRSRTHPASPAGRHRPNVDAGGKARRRHEAAARRTDRAARADPRVGGSPRGRRHLRRGARAAPAVADQRAAEGTFRTDPHRVQKCAELAAG